MRHSTQTGSTGPRLRGRAASRRPARAAALGVGAIATAVLLSGCTVNEIVFLDLPEPNGDAMAMAREAGMAPVFEAARMYAGPAPALPLSGIYGITSFELG